MKVEAGCDKARKHESHGAGQDAETRLYSMWMLGTAGIVTALWLILLLLWYIAHALLMVFGGVLVGVFLHGASSWVATHSGFSRGWSLAAVIFCLVVIAVLGFWLLVPNVAAQIGQLIQELPRALDQARERFARHAWAQPIFQQIPEARELLGYMGGLLRKARGFLSTTLGALTSLLVILFFGIYLAVDPELYKHGLIRLVPVQRRDRAGQILDAVGFTLHWWLIGRFINMVFVGILTWIGLWLLGAPLALTLALIAAVLNFIPNIGPILSAVPAVLLSLQQGQAQALYVILLYTGIQTVESYLVTPLVQKRTVSLPPVLTFFAQIAMWILLGLPGLIFAIPFAAVMLVIVKMIYVEDLLGDTLKVQREE